MGWKNVKDHYRIVHQVQVTEAGICIGSPYIHDIIVVSLDGRIVKEDDRTLNGDLMRYQKEMKSDLGQLKELVISPDTFAASLPVYTYEGAKILEKQCEEPDWPNVTHDGLMMYENTFSTDRAKVVEWAKRNCLARIDSDRRYISEQEERLSSLRVRLNEAEADAVALGIKPPSPQAKAEPSSAFAEWLNSGPDIAKAAGIEVEIVAITSEGGILKLTSAGFPVAPTPQENVDGVPMNLINESSARILKAHGSQLPRETMCTIELEGDYDPQSLAARYMVSVGLSQAKADAIALLLARTIGFKGGAPLTKPEDD